MLQHVLERFTEEARSKPVEIKQSLPAEPLVVRASEDGLDSILHNLIGNAIKYTPAGGFVRVECSSDGEDVVMRVAETGIGISKKIWCKSGRNSSEPKTPTYKASPARAWE